jgi:hypothetical protein
MSMRTIMLLAACVVAMANARPAFAQRSFMDMLKSGLGDSEREIAELLPLVYLTDPWPPPAAQALASADAQMVLAYAAEDGETRERLETWEFDDSQKVRFYVSGWETLRLSPAAEPPRPEPLTYDLLDAFYDEWCYVSVTSDPEKMGQITLDGRAWGTTDTDGFARRGKYRLHVEKGRCVPFDMEVEVRADQPNVFSTRLNKR